MFILFIRVVHPGPQFQIPLCSPPVPVDARVCTLRLNPKDWTERLTEVTHVFLCYNISEVGDLYRLRHILGLCGGGKHKRETSYTVLKDDLVRIYC